MFDGLSDDDKVQYITKVSKVLEGLVNDAAYQMQLSDFNSQEHEYKINWKQEVVAKGGVFVAKKKYALYIVSEKEHPVDKLFVRGLELIQSSTPESFKPLLKEAMLELLKINDKTAFEKLVFRHKKDIYNMRPEEIACNISFKGFDKYNKTIPWHVRGAKLYSIVLNELGITGKYPPIQPNNKIKVIYLKKNKFNSDVISFPYHWPDEFDKYLQIDYEKMIEKFYTKKLEMLLDKNSPIVISNKQYNLLNIL